MAAACIPDMFCNFYLSENHKIDNNSTITKAEVKMSEDLISLNFRNFFEVYVCLNLKEIKFYLLKLATNSNDNQPILSGETSPFNGMIFTKILKIFFTITLTVGGPYHPILIKILIIDIEGVK